MERFDQAASWLDRGKSGDVEMFVAAHSLAETYATLSVMPLSPQLTPPEVQQMISDVASFCKVVTLSASDYETTIREMAALGIVSGGIYDALIACAARKAGVDRLLTFNTRDFKRVWPEGETIIREP